MAGELPDPNQDPSRDLTPPQGRLPERDRRAAEESRFHLTNIQWGVLLIVLSVAGTYLAFTKELPFSGDGYTLSATFRNGVNIRADSPVRIAGVNVGEVKDLERDGNAARVTFTVEDDGRPVQSDAVLTIRPRLFFEGNFFIDLEPGSPTAKELDSGATIPISQTATAVQFDQILAALRAPYREDLGRLLEGYGLALNHQPTAAEDETQDPDVYGESAGEALNDAFDTGARAGRSSAQVAEAFLGTEPHDLSRLIAASADSFGALARSDRELQELVSNWNTFTGALAAESARLSESTRLLGPTLETAHASLVNLNRSLPALRRFSIELEPAVAELPETITAGYPWLKIAQPLLSRKRGGRLAAQLRLSTPGLAGAAVAGPGALRQLRLLSRCTADVLVPAGDEVIADAFSTGQPNYREFFYSAAQIAGESQNFDGNGLFLRVQGGGGPQLARAINPRPVTSFDRELLAYTISAPLGTQPVLGPRPPKRGGAACFKQAVPRLTASAAEIGPPSPKAVP